MKRAATLTLLLLLAGCGGNPTHFYALAPMPPTADGVGASGAPVCPAAALMVRRISLPETLDRLPMVRADGPARLAIDSQDRWGAPLDEMIRRVLAEDLRSRLPPGRMLLPGDTPPPGGASALDINIQRFAGDRAGQVTLQGDWTLVNQGAAAIPARLESVSVAAASSSAEDVAAAMSRSVGVLADRIAGAIQRCPPARHKRRR